MKQKQNSFWNMKPIQVKTTTNFNPVFNLKLNPQKVKPFSPVKLAMYPQRTPREIKMIDRKPWADTDKDGVPNYFDCKPNNKLFQDFGRFKYRPTKKGKPEKRPVDMTAAERFGGANIRKLNKLGEGADRKVYALDKNKVLKVAKRPRGITQNLMEGELGGFLDQVEHFETGKDYVVMEKAEPLTPEQKKSIKAIKKEVEEKSKSVGIHDKNLEAVRVLEKAKREGVPIALNPSDLMNYDFVPGELLTASQWKQKKGQITLVDPGGLTKSMIEEPATIKGLQHLSQGYMTFSKMKPEEATEKLREWNKVKYERQLFRKKGAKEEKKEIHPYTFQDTHQERIIHSDWKSGNPYAHVLEGTGDIFRESAKRLGQDVEFVDSGYINEKIRRIKSHIEDVERMKKEKVWDADYAYYKTKLEDPNAGIQMVLDSKRTESFRHFKKLAEKGIETGIHPLDSYEAAVEAHPEKINKMVKQWRKQPVQTKLQEAARQLNIAMLKKDFEKAKQIIPKIEEMTSNQKKALEPLKTTIELVKEEDRKLTELKYSGASEIGLKDIADAQARKESVNKLVSESLKNMKWDKKAMAFPPKKEEDEDKRDYKEVQKDLEGNIIQGQRHGNFLVTSAGNYIWRPTPEYRRESYKKLKDAGVPVQIANQVRSWRPQRVKAVIEGKTMSLAIKQEKKRIETEPKTPQSQREYMALPEVREHKRKVDKEVYHADVEKARATSREKYANNIDRKRFLKRKEYYMKKDIPNPTLLFEAMETSRNLPETMKSMAVKESKIKTKTKPAIIIPEKKEEKISTLSKITRFFGFKGDKRAIALPGKDLPAQHHIGELKLPLKEAILDERSTETLGKPTGKGVTWTSTYTPKEEYPSDWAQFAGENLPGERGKGTYLIRPLNSAKIYEVKTEEDVKELRKKYGKKPKFPYGLSKENIDWEKFSKDYDAVRMAPPALWQHRMDRDFSTYTWDVESTAFMRPVFRKVEKITRTPEGTIIKQQVFPETTTPQPKVLKSLPDVEFPKKYYHGTASILSPDILEKGILPSRKLPPMFTQSTHTDPKYTYFFDEPQQAHTWAKIVAKRTMGKPVVLEISDLPEKKVIRDVDMEGFYNSYKKYGKIPPEKIKKYEGDVSYPAEPRWSSIYGRPTSIVKETAEYEEQHPPTLKESKVSTLLEQERQEYGEQEPKKIEPPKVVIAPETKYRDKVEVIKNPSQSQLKQMRKEALMSYGLFAQEEGSLLRSTQDAKGNKYYWKAHQALHSSIEPFITKEFDVEVNQNMSDEKMYEQEKKRVNLRQRREQIMKEVIPEELERIERFREIKERAEEIKEEKRREKELGLNAVQDLKEQEPSQDVVEDSIESTSSSVDDTTPYEGSAQQLIEETPIDESEI